jgi:mRNA-degrading endonuclease HigB of HigAB toxin-antitoxin module
VSLYATSVTNTDIYKNRVSNYVTSIAHTLSILHPLILNDKIKVIIVEGNGLRDTVLEMFRTNILYTNNNETKYRRYGRNELMDIKSVIDTYKINDDDLVIKISGRYKLLSLYAFEKILKNPDYEAYINLNDTNPNEIKHPDSCSLALFGMRAKFWSAFNYTDENSYCEHELCRYVKQLNYFEIEKLYVACYDQYGSLFNVV